MASAARALPQHVAIIMDGNGRWAASRHLPRQAGHGAGIDAVRRSVRAASDMHLRCLTLFGFSSENWKRPRTEIDHLMDLFRIFIRREMAELHSNRVKIVVVGDRMGLPNDILTLIDDAATKTKDNTGLVLRIAFNYGGQQEIAAGVTRLLADAASGVIDLSTADETALSDRLWSAGTPDVDLIVRTSGERRLSNFLLWQAINAELVFVDRMWPDFDGTDLKNAIKEYRSRAAA